MSRALLPPCPSFEFPKGFPTAPSAGPALWDGGRWHGRSWAWLREHASGVERVEVFMSDDPEGATLVARLAGGRIFVAVYADRDVLAGTLRRSRSRNLRGIDGLDEALRLLDGGEG